MTHESYIPVNTTLAFELESSHDPPQVALELVPSPAYRLVTRAAFGLPLVFGLMCNVVLVATAFRHAPLLSVSLCLHRPRTQTATGVHPCGSRTSSSPTSSAVTLVPHLVGLCAAHTILLLGAVLPVLVSLHMPRLEQQPGSLALAAFTCPLADFVQRLGASAAVLELFAIRLRGSLTNLTPRVSAALVWSTSVFYSLPSLYISTSSLHTPRLVTLDQSSLVIAEPSASSAQTYTPSSNIYSVTTPQASTIDDDLSIVVCALRDEWTHRALHAADLVLLFALPLVALATTLVALCRLSQAASPSLAVPMPSVRLSCLQLSAESGSALGFGGSTRKWSGSGQWSGQTSLRWNADAPADDVQSFVLKSGRSLHRARLLVRVRVCCLQRQTTYIIP